MIISFAWTAPALVIGQKTVTRRDWKPDYVQRMIREMERGNYVDAYDRSPRVHGQCLGRILLTSIQPNEPSCEIPDLDWEGEGFHILTAIDADNSGWAAPDCWLAARSCEPGTHPMAVVRFELYDLTAEGRKLKAFTEEQMLTRQPVSLAEVRERTRHIPEWRCA